MPEIPSRDRVEKLIREYLAEAKLMQVVSCIDSQPWVAHVWFAADDALNLYWMSREDRRHSREIREQPNVAGGIVLTHSEGLGQKVRGVAFQGEGQECAAENVEAAYEHYERRWPAVKDHVGIADVVDGVSKMRFYVIRPSLFVLFDEINFPDQPRQEFVVVATD